MSRVLASQLPAHLGQTVTLNGWTHRIRRLGNVAFLVLRDRSGLVQCVLEGPLAGAAISAETVVAIVGEVVEAPHAPGGFEIRAADVEVLSAAQRPLPFPIHHKEVRRASTRSWTTGC